MCSIRQGADTAAAAVVYAVLALAPSRSFSQAARPLAPEPVVVVLVPGVSGQETSVLLEAARAAVSDLPAALRIASMAASVSPETVPESMAWHAATTPHTLCVFWFSPIPSRQLHVFTPANGEGGYQVRAIDTSSQSSTGETLEVILRSVITTLIEQTAEPVSNNGESEPATPPAADGATGLGTAIPVIPADELKPARAGITTVDNTSAPTATRQRKDESAGNTAREKSAPQASTVSVDKRSTPRDRDRPDRLLFEAAYTLNVQSSEHPGVHGGTFCLGVRVLPKTHLFAGYTVALPVVSKGSGTRLTLRSHPVWIGARFVHPVGRLGIGASLAFVFDYTTETVEAQSNEIAPGENGGEWKMGISPTLVFTAVIAGPVSLLVSAGMEIWTKKTEYKVSTLDDGLVTLHDEWPVQPLFFLGLDAVFL